jgi:pyridoxine 4-dehydrogenase
LVEPAASAAGRWTLGGATVNRLGFGAMRLTGSVVFGEGVPADRERSIAVLRRAVELGVNHIDTAAFYFSRLRSANELINTALAPYPDGLVIATKVGPGRDPSGDWLQLARPDQLRGQVEENLRQLGRDRLDLVNLRFAGTSSIAEHLGALRDLQSAGLIRDLGLSNVTREHLDEAVGIAEIVCIQNSYGLGYRTHQDSLIRLCNERGIAFVPFFAIAGAGRESGATNAEAPEVDAIAAAHEITPAQLRLAWTLQRHPNILAIPGTGNPDHLTQNLAAAAVRLTPPEIAELERVHQTA